MRGAVAEAGQCPVEAIPIDAVTAGEQLQQFLRQESDDTRMAYSQRAML
jgi:hypothetical protein